MIKAITEILNESLNEALRLEINSDNIENVDINQLKRMDTFGKLINIKLNPKGRIALEFEHASIIAEDYVNINFYDRKI